MNLKKNTAAVLMYASMFANAAPATASGLPCLGKSGCADACSSRYPSYSALVNRHTRRRRSGTEWHPCVFGSIVLASLLLTACQTPGPLADSDQARLIGSGTRFVLTRDLPIPDGWARATIQDGRQIHRRDRDHYQPFCELKSKHLARPEAPQTIRADTFVSGHAKGRRGVLSSGDYGPVTLVTYIPLTSESQPDVRTLECEITGHTHHLTIAQIRGVLGDLITVELP